MAKKIVTKKITKKISSPQVDVEENEVQSPKQDIQTVQNVPTKRKCVFCKSGTKPAYTDTQALKKFVSDRGKILPKLRTGVCSKHQRMVTREIKYARHLALLPFTPKV